MKINNLASKRILILFIAVLLTAMIFAPAVFAEKNNLVDDAGILSGDDFDYVKNYIETMSENQSFDIVIVTTNGYTQNSITAFADDFFDYNGYGYGENRDGIIFAIDMSGREFVLTTSGTGINAVTDYGEEYIYDNMEADIKAGDYKTAFTTGFADSVEYLLDEYNAGHAYDVNVSKPDYVNMAVTSVIAGLIIGLLSSLKHKRALKTVIKQVRANSYERTGSMKLTAERDRYLYTNVVVRPKPEQKKSSGGTSVHTSSSGRSHGGGHSRGF